MRRSRPLNCALKGAVVFLLLSAHALGAAPKYPLGARPKEKSVPPKRGLFVGNPEKGTDAFISPYFKKVFGFGTQFSGPRYLSNLEKSFPNTAFYTLDTEDLSRDFIKSLPKGQKTAHIQGDILSVSRVLGKNALDVVVIAKALPEREVSGGVLNTKGREVQDVIRAAYDLLKAGGEVVMANPLELGFFTANCMGSVNAIERAKDSNPFAAFIPLLGSPDKHEVFFGKAALFVLENKEHLDTQFDICKQLGMLSKLSDGEGDAPEVKRLGAKVGAMLALLKQKFFENLYIGIDKGNMVESVPALFATHRLHALRKQYGDQAYIAEEDVLLFLKNRVSVGGTIGDLWERFKDASEECIGAVWVGVIYFYNTLLGLPEISKGLGVDKDLLLRTLKEQATSQISHQKPVIEQSLSFLFFYHALLKERRPKIIDIMRGMGFEQVSLVFDPDTHRCASWGWILRAKKRGS